MLGCMAAGLTNSAFFAMTPVVCTAIGLTPHQLSWIMSITVFSGLGAQWAVGNFSDRFDRTVVLTLIVTAVAAVSGFMFFNKETSFWGMAVGMGLSGALVFAVYPVSVARAYDIFDGQDSVSVSAGLLFSYSIGASFSPAMASGMMTLLSSPFGLFAYWCLINGTLTVVALYLRKQEKVKIVPVEDQVAFMPMRSTSPVAMAFDPRSELQNDGKMDSGRNVSIGNEALIPNQST